MIPALRSGVFSHSIARAGGHATSSASKIVEHREALRQCVTTAQWSNYDERH
jgi:hypothetical protein